MRLRLQWLFAGITALLVGYSVYKRTEAKRLEEENRLYREREERLKSLLASMKEDGDLTITLPPAEEKPLTPPRS